VDTLDIPFKVLIPTRDRSRTLRQTIQSCLNQQVSNLRVIVSDNCSQDDTANVVQGFNDPRLEYVNPGRRLSMSGNFEFSLAQVKDGYVMHLGDDDGLMPFALNTVMDIIRTTASKAVTTSQAQYYWPDAPDYSRANKIIFSTKPGYERRATSQMIGKVINFERSYMELPSTYSSFVHTDVIAAARRNGKYYHSRTPDSYSGFINASVLQDYTYSFTPFAIAGVSGRSNGASQLGTACDTEAKLYETENDLPFHASLAYAPSIEIIVAEAFTQAKGEQASLLGHTLDINRLSMVALREAKPWTLASIETAIALIRKLNGLPPIGSGEDSFQNRDFQRRAAAFAARLVRGARRIGDVYQEIDCADFNAKTVESAGWLAYYRLKSAQEGYDKPFANLRRWIDKL
jgi:Glycosyl transferase family 2